MSRIKLTDLQKDINYLKAENEKRKIETKELKRDVDDLVDFNIVQMLSEPNSAYSDQPRYSLREISNATGKSTGYISNLAKEHGLSRRRPS